MIDSEYRVGVRRLSWLDPLGRWESVILFKDEKLHYVGPM